MLLRHYRPFWHTVGAALRSRDGRIWTGVHLGATVGRLSICAEAVALGRAVMDGDGTIECAVAVRHPKPDESVPRHRRGLALRRVPGDDLTDYDPDAMVIVPTPDGLRRVAGPDAAAAAVSALNGNGAWRRSGRHEQTTRTTRRTSRRCRRTPRKTRMTG